MTRRKKYRPSYECPWAGDPHVPVRPKKGDVLVRVTSPTDPTVVREYGPVTRVRKNGAVDIEGFQLSGTLTWEYLQLKGYRFIREEG